jgi:enediyne biosynthesis protein E4
MHHLLKKIGILSCCFILLIGCDQEDGKRFRLVSPGESGVTFRNHLTETAEFNIFNYMYFYNGGGVAVGDLNGDGLLDIYFTANQGSNKLYLNQGDFKFIDVSEVAGVEGFNGWATGVTIADVNNDGLLDIYVGYIGNYLIFQGRNQLFINQGNDENGIPRFKDQAMEFGLDLVGFSTQAVFFDYDRDGDLDMFMLNHSLHQQGTFGTATGLRYQTHPLAGDKLLRNDNGKFVDVTKEAGILSSVLGYGLGVVVSDVNLDGWPDIFVGNDFHENDYLYINQGDGTFKEMLEECMMHTSRYTMGVDFADFNNDGFPDLFAADMLPEDPVILKSSLAEDTYDVFNFKLNFGYNHQYTRNMLQVNHRDGTFSDIGLYAGVAATDWSWATLFADFDLDGFKDIFIANGILRRSNDLDYINFIEVDSIQRRLENMTDKEVALLEKMPKIKIANFLYQNNGDSTFTNLAQEWGLHQISYSNGAAYADLDNDGDLDLIINNIEDEAFIYENRTIVKGASYPSNGFLQFVLNGKSGNLFGIGTKVFLYKDGSLQMQECMPTRGYQSSVDYRLTFGIGKHKEIDSVLVIWNDGSFEILKSVPVNQTLILNQDNAKGNFDYSFFHVKNTLFENMSSALGLSYKHIENSFVEFNREALLPHMLSSEGPAVAIGDINGDGLEDIFLGGGKWQAGSLWVQQPGGIFELLNIPAVKNDSTAEDVDAVFVDVDADGDLDLVVVSGGNEFYGKSPHRLPRLYLNDGKGNFTRSSGLPDLYITGSSVSAADFDNDGYIDLFIGTRAIPGKYGIKPDSYLLRNNGRGEFVDVTDTYAPGLRELGFVKNSLWADMDNDGDDDLIIACEWGPITIFLNEGGKLVPMQLKNSGLENTHGWWNVIYAADFDNDGDLDLVAGNLGLNSKLRASNIEPVRLYVKDFDANGTIDQILTHYMDGKEYPFYTRDEMTKQMPGLKKKYLSYRKYAEATFSDMFSKNELKDANQFRASTFNHIYIENLGQSKFKVTSLPRTAQLSTVNAVLADDFNDDGNLDILLAGNFYPVNIQMGRYDASYGLLLLGDGNGNFKVIPQVESGFLVKGESRNLTRIKVGDQVYYMAIRNNDGVQVFSLKQ